MWEIGNWKVTAPCALYALSNGNAVMGYEYDGAAWQDTVGSASAWFALGAGAGVTGTVNAAIMWQGELVIGGDFLAAGGNPYANYIAKWDGTAWSALGLGVRFAVNGLAADGNGNVYAGGDKEGGVGNYVKKWDGTAWSALGLGMNTEVSVLTVDGSGNLYAGGAFYTAGGSSVNRIAKWDGAAWSPLNAEINASVNALAMDGSGTVYAGGGFTNAGGQSTRVTRCNDSTCAPLGSIEASLLAPVKALARWNNHLVSGGSGVNIWDQGAIADSAQQVTATANTTSGDVWLASRSYGNQVELRRYTTSWGAPAVLASGVASGDIGVLFDTQNSRGMVLWANGANIVKKDFNSSKVATGIDTVQTGTRGLFSVGDAGNGSAFPLLYLDQSLGLFQRTVSSDIP